MHIQKINRIVGLTMALVATSGIVLGNSDSSDLFKSLPIPSTSTINTEMQEKYKALLGQWQKDGGSFDLKKLYEQKAPEKTSESVGKSDITDTQKQSMKEYIEKKKQDLQNEIQKRMQSLQAEYEKKMSYIASKEESGEVDAEQITEIKKTVQSRFDTKKQELSNESARRKQEIESKTSSMMSTSSTTNSSTDKNKLVLEGKKKELQSWYEEKMKGLKADYEAHREDSSYMTELQTRKSAIQSEFESKKKSIMDQYGQSYGNKLPSDSTKKKEQGAYMDEGVMAQCRTTYDTLRQEREANTTQRKDAWNAFREANSSIRKEAFTADSTQDVKDSLDSMWLQIRIVEKQFRKGIKVDTGSMTTSISLDSTLSKIETIARTTWSDLESYAQPGKEDQFRSLRDGFISVLKSNKQLLLTLMVSQAKTISEITDATCRTKIGGQPVFAQSDSLDKMGQSQLNTIISNSQK